MAKEYIKPTVRLCMIATSAILAASEPTTKIDEGNMPAENAAAKGSLFESWSTTDE